MLARRYGLKDITRLKFCRIAAIESTVSRQFRHYASSSEPNDVAILGGGITGLASAFYITENNPNARVTIYEAGSRIGGWLASKRVEVENGSVLFESGPRTLRPVGNGVLMGQLVCDLGLQDATIFTFKTAPAAKNRYLYYPDHLVRVPSPDPSLGVGGNATMIAQTLTSEPAFQGILWSLATEHFKATRSRNVADESVGDFFARRIGPNMVNRVLSAVIHGIYAGDVYQLSMKTLFPGLWRLEGEDGSLLAGFIRSLAEGPSLPEREAHFAKVMRTTMHMEKEFKKNLGRSSVFTFEHGLQQLVDKLEERLRERSNVRFLTNTAVKSIKMEEGSPQMMVADAKEDGKTISVSHSHVVSTLSPQHLQEVVFAPESPMGAKSGFQIAPAPTVMTVNLYYKTPNLHPPGFGYLIPLAVSSEQNPERALGVVFDTAYSATSASDPDFSGPLQDHVQKRGTKLTVMFGGHYWDGWTAYPSEEEGLAMAKSILRRHLNITEEPAASMVNLQTKCIPQYTVGYADRLKQVHTHLLKDFSGRVRVAGNWMRGVGVNDCLRSAWELARQLRDEGKTGLEAIMEEPKWVRIERVQKVQDKE